MDIINTFISDGNTSVPPYTIYSLCHLRSFNLSNDIYFIASDNHGMSKIFKLFNINYINADDIKSDRIEDFDSRSNLRRHGTPNTTYVSPPLFFHNAMSRIFYLYEACKHLNINEFIHTENDVLTYYPVYYTKDLFFKNDNYAIQLTDRSVTLAFSIFKNIDKLDKLCDFMLKWATAPIGAFEEEYKVDMFNEMTAAWAFGIELLPSHPYETSFVFDPGSYGQYLGGTNNGHGAGWAGEHHQIGKKILDKTYIVDMISGRPFVNGLPIFNLHIHSKQLDKFADEELLHNWK